MTTLSVSESITVDRPVEEAFAFMADVNNHLRVFTSNKEVLNYHGGPVKQGDRWTVISTFMGREIETEFTMAEYTSPNRLVYESTSSAATGRMVWRFEPVEGGTRITHAAEGEAKGFFAAVASPILKSNLKKMMENSLTQLRTLLDG